VLVYKACVHMCVNMSSCTYACVWGWAPLFAMTNRAPTTRGQARWSTYMPVYKCVYAYDLVHMPLYICALICLNQLLCPPPHLTLTSPQQSVNPTIQILDNTISTLSSPPTPNPQLTQLTVVTHPHPRTHHPSPWATSDYFACHVDF
jgi:hypothetical protein